MALSFNIKELKQDIFRNFRRFPLAILSSLIACVSFIISAEYDGKGEFVKYTEIGFTALLAIILFSIIDIFAESEDIEDSPFHWFSYIAGIIFLICFYWQLDLDSNYEPYQQAIHYGGLLLLFHLCASFIPYLKNRNQKDFWEYNKQLFSNWLIGGFYVMIIFFGLAIALLAVHTLFELEIKGVRYFQLFLAIAGLVHVQYFFSQFPEDYHFDKDEIHFNRFFLSLCKYILIPLIIIYFIILYSYGIKILVSWELPKGGLAYLILGISILGILTYLLNFRLDEIVDNSLVKIFKIAFWPVFTPLTALLFTATYRRISDYGITESRYILAAITAWLIFISLLFTIQTLRKKKYSIILLPISLAVIALISCFGPMNAFHVSIRNQTSKLIQVLGEKGVKIEESGLSSKKVFNFDASFNESTKREIRSKIDYLDDRNMLGSLKKYLPSHFVDSLNLTENTLLKLWNLDNYSIESEETIYINIARLSNANPLVFDLVKYKSMLELDEYDFDNKNSLIENMIVYRDKKHRYPLADLNIIFDIRKQYFMDNMGYINLENEDIYWELNDSIDFAPKNINAEIRGDKKTLSHINGYLFIRR